MSHPESRTSRLLDGIPGSATVGLSDRIAALRSAGRRVVDLASGDPDADTPAPVVDAAVASLRAGRTHYGPSRGTAELRRAVAQALPVGVTRDPDSEVLVTGSAKFALSLALQALLNPGDEVLVLTPAWVSYLPLVRLHGGVPVPVHLDSRDGFRVTAEALTGACTPRTRVLLVNSPTNPTGRVLDAAEVDAVVRVAEEHDLVIVSDEIYRHLVFRGEHRSPAVAAPHRTVVVDGVSKAYAMTGWRLGWLSGPADVVSTALVAHQHMLSCVPLFVQDAAVVALTAGDSYTREMVETYRLRRDLLIDILDGADGLRFTPPEGALYGYLDVGGTGLEAGPFAARLLESTGVAVLPGGPFGAPQDDHVRVSLAVPTADLTTGLQALRTFVTTLPAPTPSGARR
ncbi:aminotransferase [Nakamurella endophytica]|uniref:Aminotransferase n=1 Tax=Nakamurella endophytica TaxID=1748367 RepID=A0A917WEU4_9ACTN|nr:aminotransferase [Nakamurella endophytica]